MKGIRALLDGEVSVLHARLDAHDGLAPLLSPDEATTSSRIRQGLHRRRSVAARGLLRLLLAERLDEDPAEISIIRGVHGKPRLAERGHLDFNLAHSRGDALFAFTAAGDVGIDMEHVRPVDVLGLSRVSFSRRERDDLLSLDPSRRLVAFFEGWVRKEAVIKADGRGLSLELDSFDVTLHGPARLLAPPPGDEATRWTLRSLDAGPAVRAAVALRR